MRPDPSLLGRHVQDGILALFKDFYLWFQRLLSHLVAGLGQVGL
jgi:hypothetical protein